MATRTDEVQDIVLRLVKYTGRNVLLTGAGGTGKSTFLGRIRGEVNKSLIVAAPTSIAAINVGGSTLHSLFQIPQDLLQKKSQGRFAPRLQAYSSEKRALLEKMELLIIDEISMVRADVFEAVDEILRLARNNPDLPFGGVQLLLMGDLYQLPPVLTRQESSVFQQLFKSPYFFGAAVESRLDLAKFELVTNYRQQRDLPFLTVLNRVRNGSADANDLDYLNAAFKNADAFVAGSITLTTHHAKAAVINQQEISRISGPEAGFDAIIRGEFPEGMYPVEKRLLLKSGVPVIFLKNDGSGAKRYFNGERATIHSIEDGTLIAKTEKGELLNLERDIWRNVSYIYDQNSHSIKEKVLGEFEQFPLQLGWAMTIHKSQGLTFEQATIDCSDAFSPGQLYVGLSRLRSFNGLRLSSPVYLAHIITDPTITEYMATRLNQYAFKEWVEDEIRRSLHRTYLDFFEYSPVNAELEAVSTRFRKQLASILEADVPDKYTTAALRMQAAIEYFQKELQKIAGDKRETVKDTIDTKIRSLEQLSGVLEQVRSSQFPEAILDKLRACQQLGEKDAGGKKLGQKEEKRISSEDVIRRLKAKQSLDDMASTLGLKPSALDQLIIDSIRARTVLCLDFLSHKEIEKVKHVLSQYPDSPLNAIRAKLAADVSTRTIKFVMAEFYISVMR